MRLSLKRLCLALLAALVLSAPASSQDTRAERMEQALAHVQAQQYDDALLIFRALAGENANDYEARNWVARLQGWKGNFVEAEQLYRAVLAEQPDNVEAHLGLADVISWQGRHQEALEHLRVLYDTQPPNVEVLLRLGKLSRWNGDRRAALGFYREALALEPNNGEAQQAIQVLTEETFYRLEAGYFFEEFDFASETHGQYVELLYTGYSRTSLLGRFGFQHKFDENNGHFSLGLTRRLRERTYVRGEVGFAPRGQVLANQDYEVELTQSLHPAFALGVGYRFLNFRAANVHVVTSLMNWDVRPNLHLAVRYVPARTHFDFPTQKVWNHSGWARLAWDINRTWSPYISFGVGSENFSGLSAEQLGRFAAQTYGGGLTVHVRPRQGFRVGYFFQNRSEGRSEQQAALAFFLRF